MMITFNLAMRTSSNQMMHNVLHPAFPYLYSDGFGMMNTRRLP